MKAIIAAMALVSCAAHAEFKDGNKLYSQMQEGFASNGWFNAIGYITGVADTLTGVTICAPEGAKITAAQIYDVVKNFLEDNPQFRHFPADRIVARSLSRLWPCEKKGQNL